MFVYRFGIYGVGFFAGYFLLAHDEVMERVEKSWILLTVLGLISCAAFVIMYWGQPYPDHVVLDTVMCNVYAWLATLGVLGFMKKWGNFEKAFTRWMSSKSWGLYIFHYLPLAASAWYLRKMLPDLYPFVTYVLVAIAAFAGSFLLYEVMSRIPFVRWAVLGIKKNKNN